MCHRKIFGKYWQLDDVLESALRLNLTHITAIQPSPLSLRFGMFSQDHTCPILAKSIFPYFSHFSSIFHGVVCRYKTMLTQLFVLWFLCGRAWPSEIEPRNPMKSQGSYAAVIHCCEMEGLWPEALRLLEDMDQRGRCWGHWSHPEPWVIMGRVTQFTKGWSQKCIEVQHSATRR